MGLAKENHVIKGPSIVHQLSDWAGGVSQLTDKLFQVCKHSHG